MRPKGTHKLRHVLVLIAFGAGFLLGTKLPNVPAAKTAPPAVPPSAMPGNASVEAVPASPGVPSTDLVSPAPGQPPYIEELTALSSANDLLQDKFSVSILGASGALNPDFVFLFGLTKPEVDRFNHAVATAKQNLGELDARVAAIEKVGAANFIVRIPEYREAAAAVTDTFVRTTRDILGEQRWTYYDRLAQTAPLNSARFGRSGQRELVIHVKPMRDDQGRPQAFLSSGFDEETGTVVAVVETDPWWLKKQYPLIHQKLEDAGFIVAEP